jgi:signal transduction histidine kinase
MSVVIAGSGGDWLRIAAPKTALIVAAIIWLAIRSEPRRWEWIVVVGVLPVAAFTVSQLAAGPRASGVFVPNALVVVAVLCVLFDGALVVGVTAMLALAYTVVQFHFHGPLEAAVASLVFVAATAMMVGLVHGAASYLRQSFGQVTALHAEMLLAADQERVRIAGELHDDTVQVLVAAAARLDDHSRRLKSGDHDGAIATAASVREMIGQAVDRTRRLSFDLYPAALEGEGLGAALEVLGQDIESQGQFTVTVSVGHRRYPPEVERLAYRAVKELLANAQKHSQAGSVFVSLASDAGSITCVVEDDGIGFDSSRRGDARRNHHIGLDATTDRIRHAGGRLIVETEPGRGTRARFTIPADMVPLGHAREHGASAVHGDCGRHHADAVLAGQVGPLANVNGDDGAATLAQASLEPVAVRAERVGELDDGVLRQRPAQVGGIDPLDVAVTATEAAQAGGDLVHLAAGAQAGGGREQRERGHQQPERATEQSESGEVGRRGRAQHDHADLVREARRARILQRALAEAGLDQLEVGDACEAEAPSQREADGELECNQRQQPPLAGDDADQRQHADHRLVCTRRAAVDHVEIGVGVSCAVRAIHSLDPKSSRASAPITDIPANVIS